MRYFTRIVAAGSFRPKLKPVGMHKTHEIVRKSRFPSSVLVCRLPPGSAFSVGQKEPVVYRIGILRTPGKPFGWRHL